MICSDGIWGMYPEKELINLTASSDALDDIVYKMVENTDAKGFSSGGHHDNLTIALIEMDENSILKDRKSKKWISVMCIVVAFLMAISFLVVFLLFN